MPAGKLSKLRRSLFPVAQLITKSSVDEKSDVAERRVQAEL